MLKENIVYQMEKYSWNARTGEYDNTEKLVYPLTLKEVRARVARLPETTIWLWSVSKHRLNKNCCGGRELIADINAEEFDSDVPDYD
jgi:hypothetical protein